jgi:hypothetical protein
MPRCEPEETWNHDARRCEHMNVAGAVYGTSVISAEAGRVGEDSAQRRNQTMAIEARRGCGFRKAGGIYIVGDGAGEQVPWMPFCIDYEFSRGLRWAEPVRLFRTANDKGEADDWRSLERVGLIFTGKQYYSTHEFIAEAQRMGISRRVAQIPLDLRPGDPIALAHVAAVPVVTEYAPAYMQRSLHCVYCRHVPAAKGVANALAPICGQRHGSPTDQVAGVFYLFRAKAIEVVLPESWATRPEIRRACEQRHVTIVAVPDGDRDHVHPGWKLPHFLRDAAANPEFDLQPVVAG